MELYDVMRTTAAVREYTDDPLPDEVLHTILENARFAPSGGNRQGAQVIVVRSRATREALVSLMEAPARRYTAQRAVGETPYNSYTPSAVSESDVEATTVPDHLTSPVLNAPVLLVVCVDLNRVAALDKDLERVGLAGGASIYPLVWNILLAARNEGYGGTITTIAVAAEPELKQLLGLPDHVAVAAVVPLGRPVKQLTKLRRVAVEEFTHHETWAGPPLTG
ncbi:MAG TPA: nitroreductase family protein [Nocardioidaceae bacterium]|nr:nitroreductase family protein [Nocardioidaceae bacterium]